MESEAADRSRITLRDHIDAVVGAIDSCDPAGGKVVVGHSAGAAIAHAAVDARPDRIARVVYVGGFPTGDGDAVAEGTRPKQRGPETGSWGSSSSPSLLPDLPTVTALRNRRSGRRRAVRRQAALRPNRPAWRR